MSLPRSVNRKTLSDARLRDAIQHREERPGQFASSPKADLGCGTSRAIGDLIFETIEHEDDIS
jgi:hypothetical protein